MGSHDHDVEGLAETSHVVAGLCRRVLRSGVGWNMLQNMDSGLE